MKILVVGPGPLSTYLAVRFAVFSSHEIYLLENTIDTNAPEIIVTDIETAQSYQTNRINVCNDISLLPKADAIILASKSNFNSNLTPYFSFFCSETSSILLLQNGLNFEQEIANLVSPSNQIYSGACWIKVMAETPTRLRHEFGNFIQIGRYHTNNDEVPINQIDPKILSLLNELELNIELISNIKSVQLTKLALNIPLLLMAAAGKSYPEILHDPILDQKRNTLQQEITKAANTIGNPVDSQFVENMIFKLRQTPILPPNSRTQFAETIKMEIPMSVDPLLKIMHTHNIALPILEECHASIMT